MKRLACISALIGIFGCSVPYPSISAESYLDEDTVRLEHCIKLNTERKIWVATATVGGALATTGSTVTPIINEYVVDDRDKWVIGLSITGAIGAGLSVLGITMSSEVNDEWNQYHCDDYL